MTMASLHTTTAAAQWSGDSQGQGTVESASFRHEISVPANLAGRGIGTNTEDLLVSAAATCLSITLGLTLTRLKLPFDSLRVRSTSTVEFNLGLRLVSLVHEVEIVIAEADALSPDKRDEILRVATGAEKSCFVSRAVAGNADVLVQPRIVRH